MYAVIDCNNFFVSCERIFNPKLNKLPTVVLSNNDGCIISRSQEAKDLGIPMAAPSYKFKDLYKHHNVQVYSANFSLYGDISSRVMSIISGFAPKMEIYSIDEAFVKLEGFSSHIEPGHGMSLHQWGNELKNTIQKEVGVPVSIGIAPTKTLSKVGSELVKKNNHYDGVCVIGKDMINRVSTDNILVHLDVGNIWGIGWRLRTFLHSHHIYNAFQLTQCDDEWIRKQMSIAVLKTVWELRGIPCIEVEHIHKAKKSIVSSRSFGKPVYSFTELREAVANYASLAAQKLREEKEVAGAVGVSIITNRHRKQDRQYYGSQVLSLSAPTSNTSEIIKTAVDCLKKIYKKSYRYVKASVYLYDLSDQNAYQKSLYSEPHSDHSQKMMKTIDYINHQFGSDTIFFAAQGTKKRWQMRKEHRSPRYTTNWKEIPVVT